MKMPLSTHSIRQVPLTPNQAGNLLHKPNATVHTHDITYWQSEERRFNDLLAEYRNDLFKWLSSARSFALFKQRITEELNQYGLNEWALMRLDIPERIAVSEYIGTLLRTDIDEYLDEKFYECDLILQHAKRCDRPVYQSQIEAHVRGAPISTDSMDRYLMMLSMVKQKGYMDTYCVPIIDPLEKGRVLFSTNSKGMDAFDFYDRTQANAESLKVLGHVINDVGCLKHPRYFVDTKSRYTRLIMSQPFNLLATMIKYDLKVKDGAKRLGISASTATKHLIKLRSALGASTNHGAYDLIVRQGVIPAVF
jgi:hypothetical protein